MATTNHIDLIAGASVMANRRPTVTVGGGLRELANADSLLVPSVTFSDSSVLSSETFCGRAMAKFTGAIPGVADGFLQSSFAFRKIAMLLPNDGNTFTTIGYPALQTTGSSVFRYSDATFATFYRRVKKLGYASAATVGSFATLRLTSEQIALGNGTLGGFFIVTRFGCADAATVAGARQFCGVHDSSPVNNVEPSTLQRAIGVGHGAADTNLKLFYGGTSAQTPIDLGADFPANTLSVDVYELVLFSPRTENAKVFWKVTRLNTGHTAEGQISGAGGIILPATNLPLSPLRCWRTNNATALAVGLDVMHHYMETDY
jgi:hypothetical protein